MDSSLCEKPERHASRRLSDYLMLEGQKQKVHSLVDKVYSRKNLKLAWECVRANRGAGGPDGVTIEAFEANLEDNLERLHQELRDQTYQPQPVRRLEIPKRGASGKTRPLGIPSIYDRVCQQALVNRLEPIFEEVFDPSSFGYRKGRKTADALGKVWREVEAGNEWIVDADLQNYFGSVDHEKLMTLIGKQIADSRVLKLIQQMLKAGYLEKGQQFATPRGTPQGGVVSPLLSNILLTPFDKEMRRQGYRLTRWADDWVVTCRTRSEAEYALARAAKILEQLGVTLNREKTRIVHIAHGFEFLGFKIQRGKGRFKLTCDRIKSKLNRQHLYAIPTQKSVNRFKDQIRAWTRRRTPLGMGELIKRINPIIRGWGNYYCRSHVRKRFNQLDRWIVRRLWSHRAKRWRNTGWKEYPTKRLRVEFELVSLVALIPSLQTAQARS
ncbi:MAG TPA: group II intron reverse transcriptase/maturase [Methanomicrobiales archaeon]|nr:group II intron reverse transcriptase/maturase [Methanomicrobiales archaeon]